MTKPTKSLKSSFIFLETIFSILILSALVALFLTINMDKEQQELNIQNIENQFINKTYDEHFQSQTVTLEFTKNDEDVYPLTVTKREFNNGSVRLIQYEP